MMFVDGEKITIEGQKLLKAQPLTPIESRAFHRDTFLWTPHPDIDQNVLQTQWNQIPHALRPRAERCFYYA